MLKKLVITFIVTGFFSSLVIAESPQTGQNNPNDQILNRLKQAYQQQDMEKIGDIINQIQRQKGRMKYGPKQNRHGRHQAGNSQKRQNQWRGQGRNWQRNRQGWAGPQRRWQRSNQGQGRNFAGPMRNRRMNRQGLRQIMQRRFRGRNLQRNFAGPNRSYKVVMRKNWPNRNFQWQNRSQSFRRQRQVPMRGYGWRRKFAGKRFGGNNFGGMQAGPKLGRAFNRRWNQGYGPYQGPMNRKRFQGRLQHRGKCDFDNIPQRFRKQRSEWDW